MTLLQVTHGSGGLILVGIQAFATSCWTNFWPPRTLPPCMLAHDFFWLAL